MTANLQKCCDSCGHVSYKLSKHETQTYHLMIQGYTAAAIGRLTFRSRKTIHTYKSRIIQKLGIDIKGGDMDASVLLIHHWMQSRLSDVQDSNHSEEFQRGYWCAVDDVTESNK